jgi:hypothetical protein
MKKINILFLTIVLFSACKKDIAPATPDKVTVGPDGSINPQNADGALYVIETKNYTTNNSTSYDRFQTALAWFGKFPSVVDGGTVKVNDNELGNIFNYYTASAFLEFQDTLFRGNNANALWNVQGNAAAGVPAFSHSDNTPLPVGPYFTLPASVNINNSLTVNHTATSGAVGVIYTLRGDNGDTTKYVANSSSSISFTSAEVKSVAVSNGQIGLSIMPVTYSTATYGGKKYYFVKQNQYTRETVTQ